MPLDLEGRNVKRTLDELEAPADGEHELEFGAVTDGKDAGAQVEYRFARGWFSAAAWAEWMKSRGAAGGVKGKVKF
jgi:hypothetical protein